MTDCTNCPEGGCTNGGCTNCGDGYSVTFPPGTLVCGTGNGNFAKPGDPDLNNPILSARSGFMGIAVSWTYPNINPHAVAHTLLFRSASPDFATAAAIATVSGNHYFDQNGLEEGQTYYYWIKMVSINGTVGDLIGPASATLQPSIEQLIEIMEGNLTDSVLNQALKEKIDLITDVSSSLSNEVQERLLGDNILSQIIEQWQSELGEIDTMVRSEIIERIKGDDALVAEVNLILAKSNENAAAILEESAVRATATEAVALQVNTLQATVDGVSSSVQTLQQVTNGPNGLTAQYQVKTDVNGYVAGYGLYNTGTISEFIVRVDRFAIGTGGQEDVFPFIIDRVNGELQIALNARTLIPDAHITNAMIAGAIQSDDYNGNGYLNPGTRGWYIHKNGIAHFGNVIARGNIEASSIKAGSANIIDTLMIQGNAVTITDGTTYDSGILIQSDWTEVARFGIIYPGDVLPSAVIVSGFCNFLAEPGGNNYRSLELTLRANSGARVGRVGVTQRQEHSSTLVTHHKYNTPAQWTTYTLWARTIGVSNKWRAGQVSIIVQGSKR